MKLNTWSVVKSPIGVSLKHMPNGKQTSRVEICLSCVDGIVSIGVHVDGFDAPYFETTIPIETANAVRLPQPKRKRGKK